MTGAPPGVPNNGSVEVVDRGTDGALDDLAPPLPAGRLPVPPAWVVVPACPAAGPGLEPPEVSETPRATAAMTTSRAAKPTATASQRSGGTVEIAPLRGATPASNGAEARGSLPSGSRPAVG